MPLDTTKFSHKTLIIPANEEIAFEFPASERVYCYSQSGSFELGLQGGQMIPWTKGKGFALPGVDTVTRMNLRDTSGAENTVKFYLGNTKIYDATLQILEEQSDLLFKRPDAAENLFDGYLSFNTASQIVASDPATAQVLVHNHGPDAVEIQNTAGQKIDLLAAGEKARYIVTAGLRAIAPQGAAKICASRFFF